MRFVQLAFFVDEDLDHHIVKGLRRRDSSIDILTIQDLELLGSEDPRNLARAADDGRIVLSHDKKTMRRFANERKDAGLPMPGLFLVHQGAPIGRVIEDLFFLANCSEEGEHEGRTVFVPLR